MSLVALSQVYEQLRQARAEWKYRALKAEGELEELRMRLHQVSIGNSDTKATALAFLQSEAQAYHRRLEMPQ